MINVLNNIVKKWLQICMYCAVFLVCANVSAQTTIAAPEEEEYEYEESIDLDEPIQAVTQERSDYTKRSINEEQWKKETSDKIFNYTDLEIQEKEYKPDLLSRFLQALFAFFVSALGKVILWLLVISVIVIAVYYILKHNGFQLFSKNNIIQQNEIEEIDGSEVPEDWNVAIQDAVKSGNFNLAMRYAYLHLILLLSEKGKIKFSPNKTNHHYALELSGSSNYRPFVNLTKEYEIAWYGGFVIDKDRCNKYLYEVDNFKVAVER